PALAPGRGPGRLAGLGALPEHEVERVVLRRRGLDALAGAKLIERLAREPAVAWKLAHREVHVAVGGLVRERLLLELPDHLEHLRDVVRRARLLIRLLYAERADVLVHRRDEPLYERRGRLAVLGGALDDLVLDVGDIPHIRHAVAARAQPA